MGAYVLFRYRLGIAYFLLGASIPALPFLLHHLSTYGALLPPYYRPERLGSNPALLEALAGNLISPARGLLIYSPFLLFCIYGVILKLKRKDFRLLDALLMAVVALHWLAISSYHQWWGGASYGPRFMTDVLPIGAYFLIPALGEMTTARFWRSWSRRALGALFILAVIWSIFVHARGSMTPAAWAWNGAYPHAVVRVDDAPSRLWDWSDPQFLRGLRPASLAVEPEVLCVTGREGEEKIEDIGLTVLNRGDKPLTWMLDAPYRITQSPAETHVPGMGFSEVPLVIDAYGLTAGEHSLGGLYLTATDDDHRPVRNSPQIVPATLRVLSAQSQDATTLRESCLATPPDIHIDASAGEILGIFGPGWYDRETYEDTSWRWATSPASIFIQVPRRGALTMTATPTSFHDPASTNGFGETGVLTISVNEKPVATLDARAGQPFSVTLPLKSGWNVVEFASAAGNVRPIDIDPATGDTRQLGFALGAIELHD